MSFNHKWMFNPEGDQAKYHLALLAITNIIDSSFMVVGNSRGDPNTEPYSKSFIIFNGIAPFIGDYFYLPERIDQAKGSYSCYTNGYPYDEIVKASLVVLYDYLGNDIQIFTDDPYKDWASGRGHAGGIPVYLRPMEDSKNEI